MARRQVTWKFSCNDLPKRCFASFNEMRSERKLCDITFSVGEVSITAHRVVLAAAIPYFENIFSQGADQIPDIEPNILASLIDYAYTYELNIDTESAQSVFSAACRLGIEEVKQACCDFLSDSLEPETAWNVRELAMRFNCSILLEKADCYISENFNVISQTRDFLNYPLTYLQELLDKDDLNVKKEEEVLEAALCWVEESPDDRKNHLPELLCAIRMPLIEPQCLANIGETEELIQTSLSCRNLMDEAKYYNLFPQMRKPVCSFKIQPRRNRKAEYATEEEIENPCIYKLYAKKVYTVQSFDFLQEEWYIVDTEKFSTLSGLAVPLQNKMYFFYLSTTLQYDPKNRSFMSMTRMPTSRDLVGATALKNKIYICGGRTGSDKTTSAVECFDPAADEWTTVKSLVTSRFALSAVTTGEYIFAIGGEDNGDIFDTVEKYDLKCDKWTSVSSMLVKRNGAGAATLNGRIYVCGGISQIGVLASSEVYKPMEDQWVLIAPINSARFCFSLLPFQGKLMQLEAGIMNTKVLLSWLLSTH